jgi:hypothetical protein
MLSFSFLLMALGIALIVHAWRRADSVVGIADQVGAELANKWNGKVRQPKHVWYYVGGGTLIIAGAVLAVRRSPVR